MKIEGKKIVLRAIEPKDNSLLLELINDPSIEKMVGGSSWPVSSIEQEQWLKEQLHNKGTLRCIVEDTTTNKAIGTVILSDINYKNGNAQVHIKLVKDAQGNGYGLDALSTIVKYAFAELRLNCVYAEILSYNLPSVHIFEKCGFTKEGVLRERVFKNGKYSDVIVYSILFNEMEHMND